MFQSEFDERHAKMFRAARLVASADTSPDFGAVPETAQPSRCAKPQLDSSGIIQSMSIEQETPPAGHVDGMNLVSEIDRGAASADPSPGLGLRPSQREAARLRFSKPHTVQGGLTDSGYASAYQTPSLRPPEPAALRDYSELHSIYSAESSIREVEIDTYKAELADSLINKILQLGQGSPEAFKVLSKMLPEFLRAFAVRLGQPGATIDARDIVAREVMFFVYKHRL